jgi:hypothetical protein
MPRRIRKILIVLGILLISDQCLWYSAHHSLNARRAKAAPQTLSDETEDALSPATRKLRELAQPEAKAKAKADMERPPFEFLRAQIAPFEVLPFYKANHWLAMTIEVRSSREDFAGSVRTQPISIHGSQRDVIFARPVDLDRNTPTRMSFPMFMPPGFMPRKVSKLIDLDLYRDGGLRPTEIWQANVRAMEPHQMSVVVLARDAGTYTGWGKMMAGIPSSISRDATSLDRGRYYRFVLNEKLNAGNDTTLTNRPLLPPSMLYWTTISHVIWDGQDPDALDVDQQRAMIDWLHWGGQLVIVGGADSRIGLLRESFLAPFLPADPGGTNRQFDAQTTKPLAEAYRPPYRPVDTLNEEDREGLDLERRRAQRAEWAVKPGPSTPYYDPATPVLPLANTPLFVTGLRPRPGATTIPFGSDKETHLAVEWRVGRGRVTILATNPSDPALSRWRGLDTLVRRVVMRRPEEVRPPPRTLGGDVAKVPMISGPDLSWFRLAARDTGGPYDISPTPSNSDLAMGILPGGGLIDDIYPTKETATWTDLSIIPSMAREMLEKASGIRIPNFSFVAKSLAVYLVLLVPANWLVFRGLGRKEWAWLIVPPLALVMALSIERLAAYDLGFSRGRDEIAILEMQAEYPRGHLTRIGALASTGRDNFRIEFPNDLNAVCLPLAYSASRAEQRETSSFEFMPVPALTDFRVQPRSISYYRSEQMVGLPGPIRMIEVESTGPVIENRTRLVLRDVSVIDPDGKTIALGEIGPGESKPLKPDQVETSGARSFSSSLGDLDPKPYMNVLKENPIRTLADKSAWRLIAWSDVMIEGVNVTPIPDRVRGLTVIVVNLKNGDAPDPTGRDYDMSDKPLTITQQQPAEAEKLGNRVSGMQSIMNAITGRAATKAASGAPGRRRRMTDEAKPGEKSEAEEKRTDQPEPEAPATRSPQ